MSSRQRTTKTLHERLNALVDATPPAMRQTTRDAVISVIDVITVIFGDLDELHSNQAAARAITVSEVEDVGARAQIAALEQRLTALERRQESKD